MVEPCIVKISLYSWWETTCIPGEKSSARTSSASIPPARKKTPQSAKRRIARDLWSVSEIHRIHPVMTGSGGEGGGAASGRAAVVMWTSPTRVRPATYESPTG